MCVRREFSFTFTIGRQFGRKKILESHFLGIYIFRRCSSVFWKLMQKNVNPASSCFICSILFFHIVTCKIVFLNLYFKVESEESSQDSFHLLFFSPGTQETIVICTHQFLFRTRKVLLFFIVSLIISTAHFFSCLPRSMNYSNGSSFMLPI